MKNTTPIKRSKRIALIAFVCAGSVLFNSCTTTNTAYQVQTQPMNPDLEKKILQETGLSGMAIGAGVGAVLGGGAGALYGAMRHHDKNQLMKDIGVGAGAGMLVGGGVGLQKGQQKGQQMVSSGMTKDKAQQLVKASRAENQRLAAFNAGLKRKIAATKTISDPNERKVAYASLKKQADEYQKKADATISMRNKALQTQDWGEGTSTARSAYKASTNEMIQHRTALASLTANVE